MKIQAFELESGHTIANLLTVFDVGAKRFAIEVNQAIVPRSQHADYTLSEGDVVEVVVAIGGG